MDVLTEARGNVTVSGRLDSKTGLGARGVSGGFAHAIRALTTAFAALQKSYKQSLANDGKVIGTERLELIKHCDQMIEAAAAALYHALPQTQSSAMDAASVLSFPADPNHFRLQLPALSWELKLVVRPLVETAIGALLSAVATEELTPLLRLLHSAAADGVISAEERQELAPHILQLTDSVVSLRCHIEACASSV